MIKTFATRIVGQVDNRNISSPRHFFSITFHLRNILSPQLFIPQIFIPTTFYSSNFLPPHLFIPATSIPATFYVLKVFSFYLSYSVLLQKQLAWKQPVPIHWRYWDVIWTYFNADPRTCKHVPKRYVKGGPYQPWNVNMKQYRDVVVFYQPHTTRIDVIYI